MSVTYTVAQATPYSILYTFTSTAGTAPATLSVDTLTDYATAYGAGYADTPFYTLLANGGVGLTSPGAGLTLLSFNCDVIDNPFSASAGFQNFLLAGSWSGVVAPLNFRFAVTDRKAANADTGINIVRIVLRHSIVR